MMKIKKGVCQPLILKLLSWSTLLLSVLLTVIGLFLLIVSIHASTLPYNSEGNYFDGEINHHEQSVTGFALMAVVFFLGAAISFGIRVLVWRVLPLLRNKRTALNLESGES